MISSVSSPRHIAIWIQRRLLKSPLFLSVSLCIFFSQSKDCKLQSQLNCSLQLTFFSSSQNVLPSRFCVCFFGLKHLLKQMKQLYLSYLNTLVFLRNIRTESYSSLGMQTDRSMCFYTLKCVWIKKSRFACYWDAIPGWVGGQLKSIWDERCIKWFSYSSTFVLFSSTNI